VTPGGVSQRHLALLPALTLPIMKMRSGLGSVTSPSEQTPGRACLLQPV
jgi:hypothetical protein